MNTAVCTFYCFFIGKAETLLIAHRTFQQQSSFLNLLKFLFLIEFADILKYWDNILLCWFSKKLIMFLFNIFFDFLVFFSNFNCQLLYLEFEVFTIFNWLLMFGWRSLGVVLVWNQFLSEDFCKFFIADQSFGPQFLDWTTNCRQLTIRTSKNRFDLFSKCHLRCWLLGAELTKLFFELLLENISNVIINLLVCFVSFAKDVLHLIFVYIW